MFPPWHKHKTTFFHVSLYVALRRKWHVQNNAPATLQEDNTHRGKPWNLDDFNEEPDPPLCTLFGQEFWSALHHKWPHKSLQSGSIMVLAVKPVKRELELLQACSLAALWMFCFRCHFSCCQTFPGKTISSCWEPMWWAQSSLGNSWTVSMLVSSGKLSENKVTKYKQVAQQLAEPFSNGLSSAWPEQP